MHTHELATFVRTRGSEAATRCPCYPLCITVATVSMLVAILVYSFIYVSGVSINFPKHLADSRYGIPSEDPSRYRRRKARQTATLIVPKNKNGNYKRGSLHIPSCEGPLGWQGEGPLPLERMCRDSPGAPLVVPLHPAAETYWRSLGYLA